MSLVASFDMNKIRFIIFLLFSFLLFQCHQRQLYVSKSKNPNIIIIFADDLGYGDIGCFGAENIETPHLDQLAKEGAKFTQFYTTQPVCSAARAALLTGCYSNRVGIHQALMPDAKIGLNPQEVTIADMLKDQGYRTAIFGKWHLGDHPDFMPLHHGFDEFFGIPYSNDMWPHHPQQGPVFNFKDLYLYENDKKVFVLTDQSQLTTQITEKSVDFIQRNKNNPFFLYVPHPQPHVPLFVSEKFKGKSKNGLYGDVIMEIDWSVGQIMQTLRDLKIDKNTIIIFTSDNGPWLAYGNHSGSATPFREGKGTVWEGGVREPCIISYPGVITPGTTIATPLMTIDVLPTLASITGARLPKNKIDGTDVLPVWKGKSKASSHEAFYFYYGKNELQAIRYKDWKMYFPHTYITLQDQPQGKDGIPGQPKSIKMEKPELYDLKNDVSERHNIADQHPEIVQKIHQLADGIRKKLGDKLTDVEGNENRLPGKVKDNK